MRLIDADKLKARLKGLLFTEEEIMISDDLDRMKGFNKGIRRAISIVENALTAKHDDVTTERAKLLPCPFCGKDAVYITENKNLNNGFVSFSLHHESNSCVISEWHDYLVFDTEEDAARNWNKRIEGGNHEAD